MTLLSSKNYKLLIDTKVQITFKKFHTDIKNTVNKKDKLEFIKIKLDPVSSVHRESICHLRVHGACLLLKRIEGILPSVPFIYYIYFYILYSRIKI